MLGSHPFLPGCHPFLLVSRGNAAEFTNCPLRSILQRCWHISEEVEAYQALDRVNSHSLWGNIRRVAVNQITASSSRSHNSTSIESTFHQALVVSSRNRASNTTIIICSSIGIPEHWSSHHIQSVPTTTSIANFLHFTLEIRPFTLVQ